MMFDMSDVVKAVCSLVVALITCFLIPLIKKRTTSEQYEQIKLWVKIAVQAAEQLYKGRGRGEEKKQYVLKFLESKGMKIDAEVLDALIESAVFDLPQYFEAETLTEENAQNAEG